MTEDRYSGSSGRGRANYYSNPNIGGGMRDRAAAFPVLEKAHKRLIFLAFVFLLFYVLIIGRLFDVMVLNPDQGHKEAARAPIPSMRADITDRNGELLATSLTTASLSADPALILNEKETLQKLKGVFPELDTQKLSKEFHSGTRFVWVKRNLSPKQQSDVNNLGLPGLNFESEDKRVYPKGNLTAHVIGYNDIDHNGIAGLELEYDKLLRNNKEPLKLSLDVRIQSIMHDALAETVAKFSAIGAGGLILDVHTGELLAMVSLPDFDPANPGAAPDLTRFNRVTLGTYEMGSTFKTFTIAEALDKGLVTLADHFNCINPIHIGRFTIKDFDKENRWLNVPEIYLHSSNIGAVHISEKIGPAAQKEFMKTIGMLDASPIELPEVGRPQVPADWTEITMMTVAFGHGIAVTAMQLASATAAMINGGFLIKPTLLKSDAPQVHGAQVISDSTSKKIRMIMRAVVTDGTGKSAAVPGYVVGGKTGTAEKKLGKGYNKKANLSSFIAAFPIHDPKYLVYVMIDEPKGLKETYGFTTGGWTAAPAVAKIISQSAPLLHIMPYDENDPAVLERLRLPVPVNP